MSKQTPTLLITGFGPFPGAPDNPSQMLIEAMAQRNVGTRYNLVYGLLPTHWQNLPPILDDLFARHQPDVSIHLGYSARSPGFCLEQTAYNQTCEQPDVDGVAGSCDPILEVQPAQLTSDAPIEHIQQLLSRAGFGIELSNDPGRYLCNMSYFLSLTRSRSSLFVHIPAIKIDAGLIPADHQGDHHLSLQDACNGLELIVDSLACSDPLV